MFNRTTTMILSAALSVSTLVGIAAAQEAPSDTNADGSSVVASDSGNPTASGEGSNVVYGDINTGGGGGEVLGDPSAVNSPGLASVPVRDGNGWVLPVSDGHNDMAPAPAPAGQTGTTTGDATTGDPAAGPAPVDGATTTGDATTADGLTTTDIQSEDGNASSAGAVPVDDQAGVPVDGTTPPVDEAAAAPADAAASGIGSCAAYASWYDAQVAYEGAGGTGADAATVAAFDPDGDGIACEEMM